MEIIHNSHRDSGVLISNKLMSSNTNDSVLKAFLNKPKRPYPRLAKSTQEPIGVELVADQWARILFLARRGLTDAGDHASVLRLFGHCSRRWEQSEQSGTA